MAKRKTKAQREREQRDALHQRVRDIANGAHGYDVDCQDEWIQVEAVSRMIPVLQSEFGKTNDDDEGLVNGYLFSTSNLDEYQTVKSIVDFYFRHGVRA